MPNEYYPGPVHYTTPQWFFCLLLLFWVFLLSVYVAQDGLKLVSFLLQHPQMLEFQVCITTRRSNEQNYRFANWWYTFSSLNIIISDTVFKFDTYNKLHYYLESWCSVCMCVVCSILKGWNKWTFSYCGTTDAYYLNYQSYPINYNVMKFMLTLLGSRSSNFGRFNWLLRT